MARARNIKPGLYKNEDLAECSIWARYIFPGLWMLADRDGRLEDRPKRIKGELLPFDSADVEPLLAELARFKFILRYTVDGVRYIQIRAFTAHQTPHYSEKESVIPPPPIQEDTAHEEGKTPGSEARPANEIPGALQEDSENPQGIKRGSQPPDSLIPDSLIPDSGLSDSPNPDSGKRRRAAASAREREAPEKSPGEARTTPESLPSPTAAAALAVDLRKAGIACTSADPRLLEILASDPDRKHIDDAIGIARMRKPGESIAIGYLAAIHRDCIAKAAAPLTRPGQAGQQAMTAGDALLERNLAVARRVAASIAGGKWP